MKERENRRKPRQPETPALLAERERRLAALSHQLSASFTPQQRRMLSQLQSTTKSKVTKPFTRLVVLLEDVLAPVLDEPGER